MTKPVLTGSMRRGGWQTARKSGSAFAMPHCEHLFTATALVANFQMPPYPVLAAGIPALVTLSARPDVAYALHQILYAVGHYFGLRTGAQDALSLCDRLADHVLESLSLTIV